MKRYAAMLMVFAVIAGALGFFGVKQYVDSKITERELQEISVEILRYEYYEGGARVSNPWLQFVTENDTFIVVHNVYSFDIDAWEDGFVHGSECDFLIDKDDITLLEKGETVEAFGVSVDGIVYLDSENALKEEQFQNLGGLVLGCFMSISTVVLIIAAFKLMKSKF